VLRRTKKGLPMASLTVEDLSGSVPVTVFPKFYEELHEKLVKDRILLFRGKTNVRDQLVEDEEGGSAVVEVHAEEVLPFHAGNGEARKAPPAVNVRLSPAQAGMLPALRNLLAAHPGEAPLLFHIQNGGKTERVLAQMRVDPSVRMLEELQRLTGRGTAWVE
jgi:DNA polymerase-3 subunit alpha